MQSGSFSYMNRPVQFIEGNPALLYSKMAIHALHEFMEFMPQMQSESGTEVTLVEGAIVTLARLDAYLATIVTCFHDDSTDKAGGHWWKL